VLRANGYTVLEAPTGELAERASLEFAGAIALLLTDVVMPGINGPVLAKRLRSSRPFMKVLYMSGHSENVLDLQDEIGPGTDFLQKPFRPTDLVHRTRTLLDLHS
jgi:DNA-binding response OmpR family regulator